MARKRYFYKVLDEIFTTQEALKERCRKIIYGYVASVPITDEDARFVVDLVANYHPQGSDKIGCGVESVSVCQAEYGTRCFRLARRDGTFTDVSFGACVKPPTKKSDALAAFRNTIKDQIDAFASDNSRSLKHVDYVYPLTFSRLVADFMAAESITFDDIDVEPVIDNVTLWGFLDKEFERRWQEYHRTTAVLKLIDAKENMAFSNKPR